MSLVLRTASRSKEEMDSAITYLNDKINGYGSIGAFAADTENVYKIAELVRQLATDQFMITDPTDMILERRAGPALGDRFEIEEYVNTARVVQRSLGGKPRVFTPHKKKYAIEPKDWRIDFGFELERIATRQIDARVWVDQMADAISRFYVSSVLSTLDAATAVGVNDAYGRPVRTLTNNDNVTEAAVDAALRRLGDVNPGTVIMGRYYALYPLFKLIEGVTEIGGEEFRNRGAIGRFRGATVVVLKDGYNPFFSSATVPDNRIYIAGGEKGGWLSETDMSSMQYSVIDQEEQHFRVGVKGRTAFDIFKPWRYHVIEINGGGG